MTNKNNLRQRQQYLVSIEKPTELEEIGENWKTVNVEGEEKRKNRANQGGDEKEEEEEEEKNEEKRRGTTSIKVTAAQADPPREEDLHNKNENSGGSTTIDSVTATTTITTPITETITASTTPTTTANNNSSLINSTLTTLNNITTETTEFNATLNYTEGGTRESLLNGNLFEYPAVGQCRFSALYQTVFNGARLLKRLLVDTPSQCLAACHYESCRSANLIQMEDKQKICELFRDSVSFFFKVFSLGSH
ncbi:unnamed protein product [Meloidogyne enterolobii]|uniref:Uncharacterized protein n=1 Tax=Meloidogyne enterolobii TaxID=390850 RepID=A0ACB0YTC7_MELEN